MSAAGARRDDAGLAARIAAGRTELAAGRIAAAGEIFAAARRLAPGHPAVLHGLGLVALRQGDPAAAEPLIAAALAGAPGDGGWHDHHGLVLAALGRVEAAEAAYRRAIAHAPALASAHNNLANLLRGRDRAAEALAAVDRAIALDPGQAPFHLNRGEILIELGEPAAAAASFAAALKLRPDYADAYFALGQLWQRTDNHDGARAALRACLALDPADRHGAAALLALIDPGAPPVAFSPAYVRNLFDGYAGRFDAHLTGPLQYRGPQVLRAAIDEVAPAGRWDVLDIGCGTGLAGAALADRARRLVGVDLSPAMIDHARARAIYETLLVDDAVAAMRRLPAAFDLIVAADMLIYVAAIGPVLAAMHGALRPGGLAAFTIESCSGAPSRLMPSRRFAHDPDHVARAAAEAGLAVALSAPATVRIEAGSPVPSRVMVLRKP